MSTPFHQLLIHPKVSTTFKSGSTNLFNQTYLPKFPVSSDNKAKIIPSFKQLNISCNSSPDGAGARRGATSTGLAEFQLGDYLAKKVDFVNKALEETMANMAKTEPLKLYESMRYTLSNTGGKRFKPILCLAACELVGGQESSAMPAACAVEMIHAASLMIDDLPCADNDDFRRGKPSNHKIFGETITVHAIPCLVALAFEHLAATAATYNNSKNYNFNNYKFVRVIKELARNTGVHGMLGGQAADFLYTENGIADMDLETYEFIADRKSGFLIECSVVMGAILGGGSDEEVALLRKYGSCLSRMFQYMDDLLDLEEDAFNDKQATYPKLIGVEKTKEIVLELRREAEETLLSGFDPKKAAYLIEMANYCAYRSV